ncbi:hypothetical protein RRG08_011835 [Elysia crispata]|uniref:Uncharacterized protein n=1 Tax=Elysia crispata TaxID=231223 RepID=A0AAE1E598_9GAST|nr:hypothetical protein RRG08_011835 [Elysia crispata]
MECVTASKYVENLNSSSFFCEMKGLYRRRSEDNVVNGYGRSLLEMCAGLEFMILNGMCSSDPKSSFTFVSPHEDEVRQSIKSLKNNKSPGLGHLLIKIGNVKRGWALRCQNEADRLAAETFLSLVKSEWTDTVSSCALNTLKRRKDQSVQILPLTENLVKVKRHMLKEMTMKTRDLLPSPEITTWRKLAQVMTSRLILFNKRRGGEVSRLLLKSYQDRPK